jgi:hypothetical protein
VLDGPIQVTLDHRGVYAAVVSDVRRIIRSALIIIDAL